MPQPGNLYNCKCDWEETDDGPVNSHNADTTHAIAAKGLEDNPGETGEVFGKNAPYFKVDGKAKNEVNEFWKPIEEHHQEYLTYKKDDNYKDVAFNWDNGGLKATHIGHIDHNKENEQRFFNGKLTSTDLEKECQEWAYQNGHCSIFCNETAKDDKGNQLPALDMILDGKRMDIRSITQNAENYANALRSKNKQLGNVKIKTGIDAVCVCLYFHDAQMFSPDKVSDGMKKLKEYLDNGIIKEIRIKRVYCVVNGDIELYIYNF